MENLVEKKIVEAGHRAFVRKRSDLSGPFSLDVRRDKQGEFFAIDVREDVEASILDVEGDHVLLMFKEVFDRSNQRHMARFEQDKFKSLIGHDERQLFVAAIPEGTPVSTVHQAKEALKPVEVRIAEKRTGLKTKDKHKRKTKGRLRQGDFFFIPKPEFDGSKSIIHKAEPISRGRGTSHICEELIREGGEDRYFHRNIIEQHSGGLSERQYKVFLGMTPKAKRWAGWEIRRAGDIKVHVRGTVRHPEHATLTLDIWHEVIPNTESRSKTMQHLAFID